MMRPIKNEVVAAVIDVLDNDYSLNIKTSLIKSIVNFYLNHFSCLTLFNNRFNNRKNIYSAILDEYLIQLVKEIEKEKMNETANEDYQKSIINCNIRNEIFNNQNVLLLCKLAKQDIQSVIEDYLHIHHSDTDEQFKLLCEDAERYEDEMENFAGAVVSGVIAVPFFMSNSFK